MKEPQVQSPGQEDPLEEGMATHSSILAWRIPWAEESGGVQDIGSQRVGYDWIDLACTQARSISEVCLSTDKHRITLLATLLATVSDYYLFTTIALFLWLVLDKIDI